MLARCMATDAFSGMPKSAAVDQTSEWRLSSFGRFHRVRFSEKDEQAFAQLEPVFRELAQLRAAAAAHETATEKSVVALRRTVEAKQRKLELLDAQVRPRIEHYNQRKK